MTLTTKDVSAWPVGLVTPKTRVSAPVVNSKGQTIEIHDGWKVNRAFPMDFAGFAISTKLILNVNISLQFK